MRHGNQGVAKRGWLWCTAVGLGLIGARPAVAAPMGPPSTGAAAANQNQENQSPMLGRSGGSAPYSVRLKITGFLARQHARDGDTKRALIEFHSMLNVDDPSWPDSEEGDSMRIARDIEVARMMAEAGFYDHSVRVLETTLILARVNRDPQIPSVEHQIHIIHQLARSKGAVVPKLNLDDLPMAEGAVPAGSETSEVWQEKGSSSKSATRQSVRQASAGSSESAQATSSRLENVPSSSVDQQRAAAAQASQKPEKKGLLSRLIPSRFKKNTPAQSEPQPQSVAAQRRPMVSPDVSPTYCPECAADHGLNPPRPGLGSGSSLGTVASRKLDQPEPPTQPQDHSPISKIFSRKRSSDSEMSPGLASKTRSGQSLTPPVVVEPPDSEIGLQLDSDSGPSLELTSLHADPSADASSKEVLGSETHEQGPALRNKNPNRAAEPNDALQESTPSDADQTVTTEETTMADETGTDPAPRTEAVENRIQVGVAGQVANPGIFTIEGTSTTLAALLRRSGGDTNQADKQTRILRSVDLHDSADNQKDFYCQRVEVATSEGKALATPIYGREVIIVDGAGQKPLYIAVMPHFILQVPSNASRPTTADQIVEQLRVYWPNIRNQEIGVLRFEDWGRAAKVARLQGNASSVNAPLSGGDVLYVDGLGLDQPQVMAAAESVARLIGAKIRKTEPDTSRTANSAK